jgi:hypothetical protein
MRLSLLCQSDVRTYLKEAWPDSLGSDEIIPHRNEAQRAGHETRRLNRALIIIKILNILTITVKNVAKRLSLRINHLIYA